MFITFQAGGAGFAVPMAEIEEVLPARDLRPLWGSQPWVAGVLVRRDRVIGVVDPSLLGGANRSAGEGEVLVLRGEPGLAILGIGMDAVTRDFEEEAAPPRTRPPGGSGRRLRCERGTFAILDPLRLRQRLGAQAAGDVDRGERDGEEDPAR